jgi:hypothetical protein
LVWPFAVFLHYAPAHALGGGSFFTAPQAHTVADGVASGVYVITALAASGVVGGI